MYFVINYFQLIKYILKCYIGFNEFKKIKGNFFKNDQKYIYFSFFLLIKIISLTFTNKLQTAFNFSKRNKFYFKYKEEVKKYNFHPLSKFFKTAYYWEIIFTKLDLFEKKTNILEIGSFEGESTFYFLSKFKNSKTTCVDPWINTGLDGDHNFETIERNFDKNTFPYKKKLVKIKKFSDDYFQNKIYNKIIFDIIHIDGFHHFEQVYKDLNNCIDMLNNNGVLIIDDFLLYNYFKDNYNENPFGAAIVFLNKYKKKFKIIKITNQLILQKI